MSLDFARKESFFTTYSRIYCQKLAVIFTPQHILRKVTRLPVDKLDSFLASKLDSFLASKQDMHTTGHHLNQ